jgi:hypothetical protein
MQSEVGVTLESAERLVEKILSQLEVKYEVSATPAPHDEHHDEHHHDDQRTIVVAPDAVAQLPPELRPFVTARPARRTPDET